MLIVFLNILIGIMGQAYSEYEMKSVINTYKMKIEKNLEFDYIMRALYFRNNDEELALLMLSTENDDENEWHGIVQ